MICAEEDLSDLLICKEKELKELQARQINFQKTTVEETQKQLHEMHRKFNQLKEDFSYNLKVLEERDRELERYETLFTQLKLVENTKQAEISDLKIKVNKLQHMLAEETKKQGVLQNNYQQKLKEHQLEVERLHRSKDADINQYCEEYRNMKQQLERKLREVEGELALQKQELLVEFDAEIKKREYEFRQKADEMSNLLLTHELKVKLLTKELEALREAAVKAAESLEVAGATNLELEKEIKSKDWEIKTLTALKDAQIQKLESEIDSVQLQWKKEKEIYERKHSEMDRFGREKDAILASVKKAHTEQVHQWESQIRELQINKETLEMELRRAEWRHTESLREKEAVIEKLEQELKALKTSWDSQIAQISRETVSKDLRIQEVQEEEVKLRGQLVSLLQDIERYKGQLSLAAEREEILERAKVQIELDWQRRCENAERNQYQKSETLIQSLTTARDQATADLQEKEKKLQELEKILSAVTIERDQAFQALQKHGHLPNGTKQDTKGLTSLSFPSGDIQKLQEQNNTLRAVIAEMRREMEILNVQELSSENIKMKIKDSDRTNSTTVSFTPDYVQSLEEENRKLKEKCQTVDKSEFPEQLFGSSVHLHGCNKSTQTFQQEHIIHDNFVMLHPVKVASETLKKHDARVPPIDSAGTQTDSLANELLGGSEQMKQVLGMGVDDGTLLHMGRHMKVMQGKLKEAARKIFSLSKEKQQLLEMVNRLRAELGTASKEGSQNSKSSRYPEGSTSALYSKELIQMNKHNLLALEHLQYQLTTQELQYAVQKFASEKSPSFTENFNNENVPSSSSRSKEEIPFKQSQMESLVGNDAGDSPNHETVPCQLVRKENPSKIEESLLSSATHSSMEEIWQILERGSSPSILSSECNNDQEKFQSIHEPEVLKGYQEKAPRDSMETAQEVALTVRGTKYDTRSKVTPSKVPYKQSRKLHTPQRMDKIRNYNIKD